jgi:membrane protein
VLLVSLTNSTVNGGLRSWVMERCSSLLGEVGALDMLFSVVLMTSLFALIYRYVPAQRLPWKQVVVGGLLTALLFSAGKWGIGLYLAKSTVPTAFGAAASLAALLLWLYYTAQIFLLGAEFTACLAGRGRKPRELASSAPRGTRPADSDTRGERHGNPGTASRPLDRPHPAGGA